MSKDIMILLVRSVFVVHDGIYIFIMKQFFLHCSPIALYMSIYNCILFALFLECAFLFNQVNVLLVPKPANSRVSVGRK